MTLQTEILSTELSDFLKQMIFLKSFNSESIFPFASLFNILSLEQIISLQTWPFPRVGSLYKGANTKLRKLTEKHAYIHLYNCANMVLRAPDKMGYWG